MSRREYRHTVRCAEKPCPEYSFRVYETRADERAGLERQRKHPWRCTRHDKPHEVLRPDNTAVQHTPIATAKDNIPGCLYWIPEGGTTGSGFAHGPGFKAHADDFPPGTWLVVTAYVETPEQAAIAAEVDAAGGE